jgi:uncharacterized protein (DUF2236 family)
MAPNLFLSEEEAVQLLPGPGSITWRRTSDARLYAVMLYPLLLQVAHPTVGAGVRDYSDFEQRSWDRLLRTIDYVSLLVYGGRDAIDAGRRLRALHKGFRGVREDGERYYALEPEAYAWVHATLLETYVAGHAHFGSPLSRPEVGRFYREYRGLGRLIGVREGDLPESWDEFRVYFDRMGDTELVRTVSVDRVLRSTREPVRPPIPIPDAVWRLARLPARRGLYVGGVGMMKPSLRERLGIRWTRRDELEFTATGAVSRALTPVMPERFRVMGPGTLRWRARDIQHGPLGSGAPLAAATKAA